MQIQIQIYKMLQEFNNNINSIEILEQQLAVRDNACFLNLTHKTNKDFIRKTIIWIYKFKQLVPVLQEAMPLYLHLIT